MGSEHYRLSKQNAHTNDPANRTNSLDALKSMLLTGIGIDDDESGLLIQLHALKDNEMSQCDLQTHIEVLRGQNDITTQDPVIEQRCLDALDLVCGFGINGLKWDVTSPLRQKPYGFLPVVALLEHMEVAVQAIHYAQNARDTLVLEAAYRGASMADIASHCHISSKQVARIVHKTEMGNTP